jgi:hypothetical protein
LVQEGSVDTHIVTEVVEQLRDLPHELQLRVLEFVRALALSAPHGVPGRRFLRFAGAIAADDLDVMSRVIEEACGQVDDQEW